MSDPPREPSSDEQASPDAAAEPDAAAPAGASSEAAAESGTGPSRRGDDRIPLPGEPSYRPPDGGTLDRALDLVRFLREACPWDAAQTSRTLVPHLLEETHEVVHAIHEDDPLELEGELGDLLLNLAFQVVLGEEEGRFDADSVTRRIEDKMRRRHPHLYGLGEKEAWEVLKARERQADDGGGGVLEGLAPGLDPLTRAHRMQERVSGVGFDWDDFRGAWDKVAEELEEVRVALEGGAGDALEEELGDLLFAVVNLTRLAGSHPTTALERANRKFHRRFEGLEALARERGIDMTRASLEVLDGLWDELKAREKGDAGRATGTAAEGDRG